MKALVKWIIPYELWLRLRGMRLKKARARRIAPVRSVAGYSYENSVDFVCGLGCAKDAVLAGSIPERSLARIAEVLTENFRGNPIRGLHVGNFVGISLAYVTQACVAHHGESCVISIDPGMEHRGIDSPEEMTLALLKHYGLTANSIVIRGYSLEQSVVNDGQDYEGNFLEQAYSNRPACEGVLGSLRRLFPERLQFCMLDGNHEGAYLAREIEVIRELLSPGGYLIVDDVSPGWFEIERTVLNLSADIWQPVEADGRIAMLQKRAR